MKALSSSLDTTIHILLSSSSIYSKPHHMAYGISVPQLGNGNQVPAVKVLSPNHWIARNSHYSDLTGIWDWGTRQFFESTAWSKFQIPENPAFYRFNLVQAISIQYLSIDCIMIGRRRFGYEHLSLVKDAPCQGPFPSLLHMAPPVGLCSIPSRILSCKTASKQQDDDLFSTSSRICKHHDKRGEALKPHSSSGSS